MPRHASDWFAPPPATLTTLQFVKLATARNAQIDKEAADDAATSAARAKASNHEQAGSTCDDELAALCGHDVEQVLLALRAMPSNPRPSRGWLGTAAHRRRAIQRLMTQRRTDVRQRAPAHAEQDRISDSGGAPPTTPAPRARQPGADVVAGTTETTQVAGPMAAAARTRIAQEQQAHIRRLEGKVLEQRRAAEKARSEQRVREAARKEKHAKARTDCCDGC